MKPAKDQIVGYVAAPTEKGGSSTIKKAKVTAVVNDDPTKGDIIVRLDHTEAGMDGKQKVEEFSGKHTALAHFNEDKETHNTFHFLDQRDAGSNSATPSKPQPATSAAPVKV